MKNEGQNQSPVLHDIDDEHVRMRTLLGDVAAMLKARAVPVAEAKGDLAAVVTYLAEHFQNEDRKGGFFTEIIDLAPRLSEQAERVSHEHQELLANFERFVKRAEAEEGISSWWEDAQCEFHELSKQLMEHEHREQELLQAAFDDDIGTGD
ncbi:MAG: hemerythrin domain-containing protein [Planctomycetota bacterium]